MLKGVMRQIHLPAISISTRFLHRGAESGERNTARRTHGHGDIPEKVDLQITPQKPPQHGLIVAQWPLPIS